MRDPLSPEALAQVPEVQKAFGRYCRGEGTDRDLLLAVRDATLSALARQTEEEVIAAAELAAGMAMGQGLGTRYFSEIDQSYFDDASKLAVRAALPVLLAPEVAKREQAERERDEARLAMAGAAHRATLHREAREAAEAERDRLRRALERIDAMVHSDDIPTAEKVIEVSRSVRAARAALGGSNG